MSPNDITTVHHGGPPPAAHALPAGRVGRYRLVGLLGRGGMGAVYEAEDPALGRRVALKVMLPEVAAADPRAKDRFLREARAQAAVEHDHVVPIFEVGEEGGTPYLTMPLLKGITLAAALVANPRPPLRPLRATLRIARQAAEGLAAAHVAGLVHRDIKPGNVWLEDPRMRVKVLDFGLARPSAEFGIRSAEFPAADHAPVRDSTFRNPHSALTALGTVVGTPYYMSPEQARGDPLDPRSDLFSLGIVLYEMTTGRSPFPGATTREVLRELAATDPPPPAAVVPDLPPALSDLVMRMLAKSPAGRPPTAAAVAAELREIELGLAAALPGQPLSLSPVPGGAPDPWEEIVETTRIEAAAAPPARRPRAPAAVWAAIGVGLVAAAAAALVGLFPPRAELLIDAPDPGWEVVVKQNGAVVRGPTRDRRFALPPGEYAVEPADPRPDVKVAPPRVALGRDGRETVYVWAEKPRPAPPASAPADRERDTAAALQPSLSEMTIKLDTGPSHFVYPGGPLPNEGFTVTGVWFPGADLPAGTADRVFLPAAEKLRGLGTVAGPLRLTPAQLARLAATPTAATLKALPADLDPGPDTVAALARFPNLVQVSFDAGAGAAARLAGLAALPASVEGLIVARLPAGAALPAEARAALAGLGVKHVQIIGGDGFDRPLADVLAGMPRLTGVTLTRTPADPAALASLDRAAALTDLKLEGAGLTDATVGVLERMPNLRLLDVRANAVTADAANRLWVALGRRCHVRWDGGLLERRP